jgi:hypothetical protein
MPIRVRFVLNKLTGEIDEFLVDDQDRTLSEADHDRIALEIGQALARAPVITEVTAATPAPRHTDQRQDSEPEETIWHEDTSPAARRS